MDIDKGRRDYFQCDREIRFMCDAGQCGIIIDMYVM